MDVGVLAQAAVHDAVQAIEKRYETYKPAVPANGSESKAAAAAAAAYRVLSDDRVCNDSFQGTLNTAFAPYAANTDNAAAIAIGNAAADAMLAEYRPVGAQAFPPGTGVGAWVPTPPANSTVNFAYLATTTPFVMTSPSQFRPGPPPAVTSARYAKDYNEVMKIGSTEAHLTPGCPAPNDTDLARFWSGNVLVQWNQAMRDIAIDRQLGLGDTARLLALGNLAASDALIAVWDSKGFYNFWRPITAIRTTLDDGNPDTDTDADWTPFISSTQHFPANSQTPPYPDYVSGANGVTGAFTTILQLFFKSDHVPFEIYKTPGTPVAICANPRLYRKFSDAAEEVVEARILLGIHFRFADTVARTLGTRVAWNAFTNALRPLNHSVHGFGYGHAPDGE